MSDAQFLPAGQVWIGFDDTGRAIAASIEGARPGMGSVMDGCAEVIRCRLKDGQSAFGGQRSEYEAME